MFRNRNLLVLLGFAALFVIALVLLARFSEQPAKPRSAEVVVPAVTLPRQVHVEVEALLAAMSIAPDQIERDLDLIPARYSVTAEFPATPLIETFKNRVHKLPGDYEVRLRQANSLIVEQSRRPQIIVHFLPPRPELPAGPLMTIIMDDLGRSLATAEALIALPEPVTFAILPNEPLATQVADRAHAAGHEVMMHLPMEPQGYPAADPGEGALFVDQSDDEIRMKFDRLLTRVPHASGSNNHMGSRFTEDARALQPVMERLRDRRMFFVDSRTTGHSRVRDVARQAGVPTMDRDVFLDNVADVDAILREISRLEDKARRNGLAIGICHPYPETLEALRRALPLARRRGITVVPMTVLLQKQAMAQGS
ncbi:MAG: divergent polysaccharide deacetylase family protein [Desulfuromonadales bacterium]